MMILLTRINQLFSYLSQRQALSYIRVLPLPQLYLQIIILFLIFVVRNKNIFIHFKIDHNMINIYKLTNLLEAGMTIFQLNQWKEEGIWYPVTQYKKASTEIEVVPIYLYPMLRNFISSYLQTVTLKKFRPGMNFLKKTNGNFTHYSGIS